MFFFSLANTWKSKGAESGLYGEGRSPEMASGTGRLLPQSGLGKSHRVLQVPEQV
jgi:hypothetical protein